jgi:hypothetical protein
MVRKWNVDDLERLAHYELVKLDERGENGEIAEAVIAFMSKGKKKASL